MEAAHDAICLDRALGALPPSVRRHCGVVQWKPALIEVVLAVWYKLEPFLLGDRIRSLAAQNAAAPEV